MTRKPVVRHEVVQPSDPTIRLIPLTQNQTAIVDALDYDFLNQWNWMARFEVAPQSFYAARVVKTGRKCRYIWLHRIISGAAEGQTTDHINGNTMDNRRCNLRIATQRQNTRNRKVQSNNSSGYKGVSWMKRDKAWRARIKVDGKEIALGYFPTAEEAARAYDVAAKENFGEFARPNFSGGGGGGAF